MGRTERTWGVGHGTRDMGRVGCCLLIREKEELWLQGQGDEVPAPEWNKGHGTGTGEEGDE